MSEQENIKAGDIVELRSGGPAMTVRWVSAENAFCNWFRDLQLEGKDFAVAQLQKTAADPNAGRPLSSARAL